jgi:hypothetical protein
MGKISRKKVEQIKPKRQAGTLDGVTGQPSRGELDNQCRCGFMATE